MKGEENKIDMTKDISLNVLNDKYSFCLTEQSPKGGALCLVFLAHHALCGFTNLLLVFSVVVSCL